MSSDTKEKRQILVADDDQSIRQLVSTIVRRERFTVDDLRALDSGKNEGFILDLLDRATRGHT